MDKYKLLKHVFVIRKSYSRIIVMVIFIISASLEFDFAHEPYTYLKEFCLIGERVPGTAGHGQARDFIITNLESPIVDSFSNNGMRYYNIYQRFPGAKPRIGIAAHWDSDIGCPGANDGGSGVALLLSLADTLKKNPPQRAVDILFFDGEDVNGAELIGSEHFAAQTVDEYSFIIVFDMVSDRNLQLFQEGHSTRCFPRLVDSLWNIGIEIAPSVFIPVVKYYIIDDHISLIKYGIRAIDVIDFDYPYWDSNEDTIDKCSKTSLDIMYNFILRLVY